MAERCGISPASLSGRFIAEFSSFFSLYEPSRLRPAGGLPPHRLQAGGAARDGDMADHAGRGPGGSPHGPDLPPTGPGGHRPRRDALPLRDVRGGGGPGGERLSLPPLLQAPEGAFGGLAGSKAAFPHGLLLRPPHERHPGHHRHPPSTPAGQEARPPPPSSSS